jgi:hypothetical protein
MKTLRLIPLALCACNLAAQSLTSVAITFAWDANSEPDLAGYRLYSVYAGSTNRSAILTATTNSMTFTNLGPHQVWVTALNTTGLESGPSNVLTVNTKAPNPPTFKIQSVSLIYTAR